MLLIDQGGKLRLARDNRTPKRNGRRAALRVILPGEVLPRTGRGNHSELYLEVLAFQERMRQERVG